MFLNPFEPIAVGETPETSPVNDPPDFKTVSFDISELTKAVVAI